MNTPLSLHGTGVALVTPFRSDNSVDIEALTKITRRVIDGKVDYLVVLGTTGESATLTDVEADMVIATVLNANKGEKPVLIGCGGNNTAEVVSRMADLEGKFHFDGFMSVTPYYNRPSQTGLFEHFVHIIKRTEKPILLYNIPGRTSVNMLPEAVLRLHKEFPEKIIGIKEASGGLEQGMEIISKAHPSFQVLIGDDILALPALSVGFKGCISVLANAFPDSVSSMMRFGLNEFDRLTAKHIHYNLLPLFKLAFKEGNPAGIKAMLSVLGYCEPVVRLPLIPASLLLEEAIRETIGLNLTESYSVN